MVGRNKVLLFPTSGLVYLLVFLCCVLGGVVVLDRALLPAVQAFYHLSASPEWVAENDLINRNNDFKGMALVWESRGHGVSLESERATRIVVLGDSFVQGDGYANMNDFWWRRLEVELHSRGYRDLEVLGLGRNGFTMLNQAAAASRLLPVFQPDIVVWGYVTNDADERIVPQAWEREVWEEHREQRAEGDFWCRLADRMSGLFPTLSAQVRKARLDKLLAVDPPPPEVGFEYYAWELELLQGENFAAFEETLSETADWIRDTQISPVFFMALPTFPSSSHFEPRLRPVEAAFERAGLHFHNPLDAFIAEYGDRDAPETYWGINPANGHPGRRSTSFYARQVADLLEREAADLLPPRLEHAPPFEPWVNDWVPIVTPLVNTPDAVQFVYPNTDELLLSLPVGRPFVQLNLRHPIRWSAIELSGEHLADAELWVTLEDPEDDTIYPGGERAGSSNRWLEADLATGGMLSTVRIAARFDTAETNVNRAWRLDPSQMTPLADDDKAWVVVIPESLPVAADTGAEPYRSTLILLEDSRTLGPSHTPVSHVSSMGRGRYLFRDGSPRELIFSTTDGSDPRSNGRAYAVTTPSEYPRSLTLRILGPGEE